MAEDGRSIEPVTEALDRGGPPRASPSSCLHAAECHAHDDHGHAADSHEHVDAADGPDELPPGEPKTPLWLTGLGGILFLALGIAWLGARPADPTLERAFACRERQRFGQRRRGTTAPAASRAAGRPHPGDRGPLGQASARARYRQQENKHRSRSFKPAIAPVGTPEGFEPPGRQGRQDQMDLFPQTLGVCWRPGGSSEMPASWDRPS